MNIAGTYTLQATPEEIWQCLNSKQALIEAFPGIERLEQADGQGYALSLHIKQAPLMGTYAGQVSITEYQSPYFCRIAISSEGRQNTLKGSGVIHLSRNEDNTVLVYN